MAVEIPAELTKRLEEGQAILFAGAGLSMPQLPGWTALFEKMLYYAGASKLLPDAKFSAILTTNYDKRW